MRFGIITFPGSNCDDDAYHAVVDTLGAEAVRLWHKDHDLKGADIVILPGGFAYGDYLRAGAIARFSPIMREVAEHAKRGGTVVGICNGFQILCEAGLLPGALLRSTCGYRCEVLTIRVENTETRFTERYEPGQVLRIPIAHGEGRYTADEETIATLEGEGRVVFRYTGPRGELDPRYNPNGSTNAIAGIINEAGNVLGLMPHPERAVDPRLGSSDGLRFFESLLATVPA
jgi:phosphoribosylformylglycinamidine synthase